MVSSSCMGTPSAVPLDAPKLDRMSLRTMPLSARTSGPLEPSPGYGPAVSSGISPRAAAVPVAVAAAEPVDAVEPDVLAPQAASPTVTAPRPSARSICRRPRSVATSNANPWSTTSSSGRGSGLPS